MEEFKTWREARTYAEEQANRLGVSFGIEKPTRFAGWTVKMLPQAKYRCGWELRCEVVDPNPPWGPLAGSR